jgi:tetratricopeptide (TPR) repeat protein
MGNACGLATASMLAASELAWCRFRLFTRLGSAVKNVLLIVTLSATFSACTTFSPQNNPTGAPVAAVAQGVTPVAVPPASGRPSDQPPGLGTSPDGEPLVDLAIEARDPSLSLPKVEFTPELLNKLLISEFAQQRGQWQNAYVNLLAVAQQTRDPRIARRAMEVALEARQPSEALAAVRLWRELDPKASEPNQYYLRFVVFGDDLNEAQTLLTERLAKASPNDRGYAILQIQQILRYAKDKNAAFTVLEQLLAPYSDWLEARLALAQSAFLKGDNARAIREARAARAIKPASEEAVLAHVLVLNDPKATVSELSDFLAVYPQSREVRLALARALIDQHQYGRARTEFEQILQTDPKNAATLFVLGVISMYEKDPVAAEKYFMTYLEVVAKNPTQERDPGQVYSYLSQIAEERGDSEAALKWLGKMSGSDSRNQSQFNIELRRATLLARRGDLPAARALLKGLRPDNTEDKVQVILTDVQILRNANQMNQAFAALEAGLKRFPNNTDLLYDHALLAEKLDRWQVMEASLRQVITLAPSQHHAYNALGYSLAERNIRLPEALGLIEKALKLAPDDPYIMDSLGWVQFRMGRVSEAEQTLRQAYGLRADPEIAVHLGEVLWKQGQKEQAQKYWQEARNKDPKSDALKNTLARLNVSLP